MHLQGKSPPNSPLRNTLSRGVKRTPLLRVINQGFLKPYSPVKVRSLRIVKQKESELSRGLGLIFYFLSIPRTFGGYHTSTEKNPHFRGVNSLKAAIQAEERENSFQAAPPKEERLFSLKFSFDLKKCFIHKGFKAFYPQILRRKYETASSLRSSQ